MRRLLYGFLPFLMLWGCSDRLTENDNARFCVPEKGLVYEPPFPRHMVFAPREDLTPMINMCAVDTTNQVSILLLNLPSTPGTLTEAQKLVEQISRQGMSEYSCITTNDVDACDFMDKPAWSFKSLITVLNDDDSIRVIFKGFIFDDNAFVVTSNASNSCEYDLDAYIGGLKIE